jgi:hypothetical protein
VLKNRINKISSHRRKSVPMPAIDPGLRRDGEERVYVPGNLLTMG